MCNSENDNCWEQCAATGKPTAVVPPPPITPAAPTPAPQPQPSPELVECQQQCDVVLKDCANKGININQCNQDKWACDDNCTAQFPTEETTEETQLFDYGDAPDPTYPSLKVSDGARHFNTYHEWLGLNVTKESDSKQVDADSNDDGITLSNLYSLPSCTQTVLPVIISVQSRNDANHSYGSGNLLYLNMLFDWDTSGSWEGASNCFVPAPEHAVVNYPINVNDWPQGVTTKIVHVPLMTGILTTNIWVRATLTYKQSVIFPWEGIGQFNFGETEDYGPIGRLEPLPNLPLPSTSEGTETRETSEVPLQNEADNKLMPSSKKSNGDACNNNDECESNMCDNGICKPPIEQPSAPPKTTINIIIQAVAHFFRRVFRG